MHYLEIKLCIQTSPTANQIIYKGRLAVNPLPTTEPPSLPPAPAHGPAAGGKEGVSAQPLHARQLAGIDRIAQRSNRFIAREAASPSQHHAPRGRLAAEGDIADKGRIGRFI